MIAPYFCHLVGESNLIPRREQYQADNETSLYRQYTYAGQLKKKERVGNKFVYIIG